MFRKSGTKTSDTRKHDSYTKSLPNSDDSDVSLFQFSENFLKTPSKLKDEATRQAKLNTQKNSKRKSKDKKTDRKTADQHELPTSEPHFTKKPSKRKTKAEIPLRKTLPPSTQVSFLDLPKNLNQFGDSNQRTDKKLKSRRKIFDKNRQSSNKTSIRDQPFYEEMPHSDVPEMTTEASDTHLPVQNLNGPDTKVLNQRNQHQRNLRSMSNSRKNSKNQKNMSTNNNKPISDKMSITDASEAVESVQQKPKIKSKKKLNKPKNDMTDSLTTEISELTLGEILDDNKMSVTDMHDPTKSRKSSNGKVPIYTPGAEFLGSEALQNLGNQPSNRNSNYSKKSRNLRAVKDSSINQPTKFSQIASLDGSNLNSKSENRANQKSTPKKQTRNSRIGQQSNSQERPQTKQVPNRLPEKSKHNDMTDSLTTEISELTLDSCNISEINFQKNVQRSSQQKSKSPENNRFSRSERKATSDESKQRRSRLNSDMSDIFDGAKDSNPDVIDQISNHQNPSEKSTNQRIADKNKNGKNLKVVDQKNLPSIKRITPSQPSSDRLPENIKSKESTQKTNDADKNSCETKRTNQMKQVRGKNSILQKNRNDKKRPSQRQNLDDKLLEPTESSQSMQEKTNNNQKLNNQKKSTENSDNNSSVHLPGTEFVGSAILGTLTPQSKSQTSSKVTRNSRAIKNLSATKPVALAPIASVDSSKPVQQINQDTSGQNFSRNSRATRNPVSKNQRNVKNEKLHRNKSLAKTESNTRVENDLAGTQEIKSTKLDRLSDSVNEKNDQIDDKKDSTKFNADQTNPRNSTNQHVKFETTQDHDLDSDISDEIESTKVLGTNLPELTLNFESSKTSNKTPRNLRESKIVTSDTEIGRNSKIMTRESKRRKSILKQKRTIEQSDTNSTEAPKRRRMSVQKNESNTEVTNNTQDYSENSNEIFQGW